MSNKSVRSFQFIPPGAIHLLFNSHTLTGFVRFLQFTLSILLLLPLQSAAVLRVSPFDAKITIHEKKQNSTAHFLV